MGFFQQKTIRYRCECDYCGKPADESRTSHIGNEWDNGIWERLAEDLRDAGWASKKTGTAGHSRRPVYKWACPDCVKKDPHILNSRRRRERNETIVAKVEQTLHEADFLFSKFVYTAYGTYSQRTGRRKLFVLKGSCDAKRYGVTAG